MLQKIKAAALWKNAIYFVFHNLNTQLWYRELEPFSMALLF